MSKLLTIDAIKTRLRKLISYRDACPYNIKCDIGGEDIRYCYDLLEALEIIRLQQQSIRYLAKVVGAKSLGKGYEKAKKFLKGRK